MFCGKAAENAAEQWKTITFAEKTEVFVCSMTEQQIEDYVKTGEPMDKACLLYTSVFEKNPCGTWNDVPQGFLGKRKMRLIGIEPTHAAPEATALSTELQTHLYHDTILFSNLQGDLLIF